MINMLPQFLRIEKSENIIEIHLFKLNLTQLIINCMSTIKMLYGLNEKELFIFEIRAKMY